MEIYQLRTFVMVAREGSITHASESLFLSQPAVSAHIKAMEDELAVTLFERTPKGMQLTPEGALLLTKAEQTLAAHRDLLDEARKLKGRVSGKVVIGSIGHTSAHMLGRLLSGLSEAYPDVEVKLHSSSSGETAQGIRDGSLDAGFLVDTDFADESMRVIVIDTFGLYLAIPTAWKDRVKPGDWQTLASLPWICPAPHTFCGRVGESLLAEHGIHPPRVSCADQEGVRRTLVAGGVGVSLLHGNSALDAERAGEILLWEGRPQRLAQLIFVYPAKREQEPLIGALAAIVREAIKS